MSFSVPFTLNYKPTHTIGVRYLIHSETSRAADAARIRSGDARITLVRA